MSKQEFAKQLEGADERRSDWLVHAANGLCRELNREWIGFTLEISDNGTAVLVQSDVPLDVAAKYHKCVQLLSKELTEHVLNDQGDAHGLSFVVRQALCACRARICILLKDVTLGNTARRRRALKSFLHNLSSFMVEAETSDDRLSGLVDERKFVFAHSRGQLLKARLYSDELSVYKTGMGVKANRQSAEDDGGVPENWSRSTLPRRGGESERAELSESKGAVKRAALALSHVLLDVPLSSRIKIMRVIRQLAELPPADRDKLINDALLEGSGRSTASTTVTEDSLLKERRAIGRSIAERRKNLGLSRRKLAEMAGLTHRTVGQVELGDSASTVDTIRRLESALAAAARQQES